MTMKHTRTLFISILFLFVLSITLGCIGKNAAETYDHTKVITIPAPSPTSRYSEISPSLNFSRFSIDTQRFFLDINWLKDGVSEDEINYLNTIPITFDPNNKTTDFDGGGLEDYYEILYKGNITNNKDDINIQLYNIIPGKGYFTMPFKCRRFGIQDWYDLDPRRDYVKNWMGEMGIVTEKGGGYNHNSQLKVQDNHFAIDFLISSGTPVIAPAPGVLEWYDTKKDGYIVMTIRHDNGLYTHYGEISNITISIGQRINRGDIIGYVWKPPPNINEVLHFQLQNTLHSPSHASSPQGTLDYYRDVLDPNSTSYWINDNDPLCLSSDNNWMPVSKIG